MNTAGQQTLQAHDPPPLDLGCHMDERGQLYITATQGTDTSLDNLRRLRDKLTALIEENTE